MKLHHSSQWLTLFLFAVTESTGMPRPARLWSVWRRPGSRTIQSQLPMAASMRCDPEGCFSSHEWADALAEMCIQPEPTAGQAHWQLGDVERTVQTLKHSLAKLHHMHRHLSAVQLVARGINAHNELERLKSYSPFQWVVGHSRPIWNVDDGQDLPALSIEENLALRTDAASTYLQAKAHRRRLKAERSRPRKDQEFHLGQLVYIWRTHLCHCRDNLRRFRRQLARDCKRSAWCSAGSHHWDSNHPFGVFRNAHLFTQLSPS